MLILNVGSTEFFDEKTQEFITEPGVTLHLEHSLISLSKWEQKVQKPFLGIYEKTTEEIFEYINAMILDDGDYSEVIKKIGQVEINLINEYIDSSATATTFSNYGTKPSRSSEVITSELVYYWMISYGIPFECENWHLNRLFALIRICTIKNSKQQKMPKNEAAQRQRMLNEQRKARLGTTG